MNPHEYQQRAYFLFERDRFREAVSICMDGLAADPADADLLYLCGLCGLQLKDEELTRNSIQSLAACAPNWSCTHDLLCYQALEQNRLDAAERHSQEAIRWDPQEGGRYGTLAYIFDRLGRREDAITAARQGLKLDVNNIRLLTQLQRLYQLNGESRLAAEMEQRAGEVNPENADWHLYAGFRLLEAGEKSAGQSRMRASMMVQPNIPTERVNAMAHQIVHSHRLFKNALFLPSDWRSRIIAIASPFFWLALGKWVWFPFAWLGWMSLILIIGWFAYEALFHLCCRFVRRRILHGRL